MSAGRVGIVLVLVILPPRLRGQEVELFPEVTVQMMAARYLPSEDAFVWDGWIGAGAGLLRVGRATAYFTADVETIIGREKRTFDANQAAYHLEAGARIRVGRHLVDPFFHHVSRHLVDRPKIDAVDWNIVGLRVAGPLPGAPGRYAASVGHTIQWSKVSYHWELTGLMEMDLVRGAWGAAYVLADRPGWRVPNHITGGWSYIRFHQGRPFAPGYTRDKLRRWAERIAGMDASDVYVYFNNDTGGAAIRDAPTLIELLEAAGADVVRREREAG